MPNYEYVCEKCNHQFELIQKFSDPPVIECPLCQGQVRKLISSPGIMFKGSGWYVTDYSDKFKGKDGEGKAKSEGKEAKAVENKDVTKTPGTEPPPSSATSSTPKKSN